MYCRHCGVKLQQGMVICPECGTRQRRQASSVRCASCHGRVSIDLTVCPRCGRDVRPAGPRWGLWAAGAFTFGLFSLWGLGQLPVNGVYHQILGARDRLVALAEIPDLSRDAPLGAAGKAVALAPTTSVLAAQNPVAALPAPAGSEMAAEDQAGPAPGAGATIPSPEATATETLIPTATAESTATPSPSATAVPTETPAPTATEPGVTRYTVRSGDTLARIGARFGVSWQSIASANGLRSNAVLRVGQQLIIPGVGGPSVSPTPENRTSAAP